MIKKTQIFVLGMHRSGTSAAARILNMMGVYFGSEKKSIGANEQNPKGFWERRDVRKINDAVLSSQDADWQRVGAFELGNLTDAAKSEFEQAARPILEELDAHGIWMLKEPRLCLLYPLWRSLIKNPVCIHVQRNPMEVALSLKARNGLSLHLAVALWEKYNLRAFEHSKGSAKILLSHHQLMTSPIPTVIQLFGELQKLGIEGLQQPTDQDISDFIDSNLYRNKGNRETENAILNDEQRHLRDLIDSGDILKLDTLPPLSASAEDTLLTFDVTQAEHLAKEEQIKNLQTDYLILKEQHKQELKISAKSIAHLEKLMESIKKSSIKLLSCRRWIIGNLISLNISKQPDGSIPYPPLTDVFERYDKWKKQTLELPREVESTLKCTFPSNNVVIKVAIINFTGERANWGCRATSWELVKYLNRALGCDRDAHYDFIPLIPRHALDQQIVKDYGDTIHNVLSGKDNSPEGMMLVEKIARQRYGKFADAVEKADIVIFQAEGTMTGTDFMRGERLLLLPYVAAEAWGKSVLAINQTIYSAEPSFEPVIQNVYDKFFLVTVRETASFDYCGNLGISCRALVPDTAFLTIPAPSIELPTLDVNLDYFAITGSSALAHLPEELYIDTLIKITQNFSLTPIFMGSTGQDCKLIEKYLAASGEKNVLSMPQDTSYASVAHVLGQCKFLIGGRYHMAILAAVAHTPSVLLPANTFKNEGLAAMLNCSQEIHRIEDTESIMADIQSILSNKDGRSEKLKSRVSSLKEHLRNTERSLGSAIDLILSGNNCEKKFPSIESNEAIIDAEQSSYYVSIARKQAAAFTYPSAENMEALFGPDMEILPQILPLIVNIRRNIDAAENFRLFRQIVEDNLESMCSQLNTRWLVSVCDTYVDCGTPIEQRNAMLICTLPIFEKIGQTYVNWRLNGTDTFEVPDDYDAEKKELWDGMTSFHLDIGDVTNNLFYRFDTLLSSTPHLARIYHEIIDRLKHHDTILGNLNKRHHHVFERDYSWISDDEYKKFRDSGDVPEFKWGPYSQ